MRTWLMRGLMLACAFLITPPALGQTAPASVEGRPRIVDGDTLEIGIHRVHLFGVDAPEPDQTCERAGKPWRCGAEATYAMAALVETHWVTCRERARDAAGEIIGVCRMGGANGPVLNREIVRLGWALATRPASEVYLADERTASGARAGIWSGSFVAPWEWRRKRDTGTRAN